MDFADALHVDVGCEDGVADMWGNPSLTSVRRACSAVSR